MSFDEELRNAMRDAAESVDPPINELVAGGLARGRRQRRGRAVQVGAGVLGAALVGVGAAIALPQLTTDGNGLAAKDAAVTTAADRASAAAPADDLAADDDVVAELALEIARLSGRSVTLVEFTDDERTSTPGTLKVTVDIAGFGEIDVEVRVSRDLAEVRAGNCQPTVGNTCDEVYVSYPTLQDPETGELLEQDEVETLNYVATTPSEVLLLGINNYVVNGGELIIGPNVGDLGIEPAGLRTVVAASGILSDASFPPNGPQYEVLESLALEIAGLADGEVDGITPSPEGASLRMVHDAGPFEIQAIVQSFSRSQWEESCALGASDGKPCDVLLDNDDAFVWTTSYASQAGRVTLRYAGDAPWGTLMIVIENYIEHEGGNKVVGPAWNETGLNPADVVGLVDSSGLLEMRAP
jgi:hypothetical protein